MKTKLTLKQKKLNKISKIIQRETGWFHNWYGGENAVKESADKAALKILALKN